MKKVIFSIIIISILVIFSSGCVHNNNVKTYTNNEFEQVNKSMNNTQNISSLNISSNFGEDIKNNTTILQENKTTFFNLTKSIKVKDYFTNCTLDGYIYINDMEYNTRNGILTIQKELYENLSNQSSELLYVGNLSKCFGNYMNFTEVSNKYLVKNNTLFIKVSPWNPDFVIELTNFVRPHEMSSFIEKHRHEIENKHTDTERMELILRLLQQSFFYRYDMGEKWETPRMAISKNSGDCEEFSFSLESALKYYNSSWKCYSMVLDDHASVICSVKRGNEIEIHIFDQGKTHISKSFQLSDSTDTNTKKIKQLFEIYYGNYGLPYFTKVRYLFDNESVIIIDGVEDVFCYMAYNTTCSELIW